MIPEKHFAVAVDGPSGAGKSTLAKAIAAKLGILYVDTGAIYRTIGYAVKRRGVEPRDEAAVRAILPELEIRSCIALVDEVPYGDVLDKN